MITAIVLAAGMSTRMGENKLLLPFKESTVIETTIKAIESSKIDEIIIVIGFEGEKVKDTLRNHNVQFAYNPNFKNGLSSSVKVGLDAIKPQTRGILFFPGDQPMLSPENIDKIVNALSDENTIIVPKNEKRKGSPVAFHSKWFDELKTIEGDQGGRYLIKKYPDLVTYVHIDDPLFFEDVDTKESYEYLKKQT